MIQSMSAPQTPVHLAPRAAQPIGATAAVAAAAAPVLDAHAAAAGQPGFGAQMARAADAEQLPAVELPALPIGALQAAPTDDAASGLPVREAASAAEESPPELTAEQWLLGMLGQQQTQVQARDAGQPAAPVAPAAIALVATAAPTLTTAEPLPVSTVTLPSTAPLVQGVADAAPTLAETRLPPSRARAEPMLATAAAPLADAGTEVAQRVADPVDALLGIDDAGARGESSGVAGERPALSPQLGGERLLKLHTPQARWGEQMLQALRDNVELQLQQKIQSATIRLDPPELGALEIHLSHESGRLNVQLTAAHADVARLLQQTSDRLRQELVGQNFVQVNVQVGADGQGQQGRGQPRAPLAEDQPLPAANAQQPATQARGRERAADVLVTV
ncbi:flagellar hook-length control protein FliK [Stutzerimonas stutzeri]|uniref:flagellar hook-length control protein FliK n=1 Tax=Stutzerimonas stutzeri TaxID=316 RepID=UPI001BD01FE4|nr:flagellar hook-length control protein FliK [Stutzerimonas stutzeri]